MKTFIIALVALVAAMLIGTCAGHWANNKTETVALDKAWAISHQYDINN
jgi:hypothetical protein